MAKTKPVKWSIGADEPEDLQEFLSNDDIVAKHTPKKGPNKGETDWPGKGPFRFKVVQMKVKPNRNGDDRISVMLVLNEPAKSEHVGWNGYAIFDGFNVVEGPSLSFLKKYLKAVGVTWKDFVEKTKQNDDDPPQIVQIGRVKFGAAATKEVNVMATVKVKPADDYNDDEHMEIRTYITPDDDADEEPDDDEEEEGADLDADEEAEEDEADEEDGDEEDEDEWTREDLEDEDIDSLKSIAEEDFGFKAKDLKKFKDTDALLDAMFPEDEDEDEDEDEGEEPDEDEIEELREELDALKIAPLRKRVLKNDKKADITDLKKKDLIDLILQQELNVPPF